MTPIPPLEAAWIAIMLIHRQAGSVRGGEQVGSRWRAWSAR
jgi:hypothetical protein